MFGMCPRLYPRQKPIANFGDARFSHRRRCRFSIGKLYGRAGDRRATEHLTSAMSLFQEMGMRFWFEKAEAGMQALEGA
jgi:hypothetical protein